MYRADGPAALRPVGETEFVTGIAAMSASGRYGPTRVAAGIGRLSPTSPLGDTSGAVLDAHLAASPRLRGIRHAAGWDASEAIRNSHTNPPPGLLADARFRRGFAELARRGLTFDAWLYHPQLSELTDLARAFPDTTIVLDHFGGPLGIGPYQGAGRRSSPGGRAPFVRWPTVRTSWPSSAASSCRSTATASQARAAADIHRARRGHPRLVLHTIDCFGVARCMFESNFPVDKVSTSTARSGTPSSSSPPASRRRRRPPLFHDTAARVYGLAPTS